MARRVFLHIGLPKTGTTYVQTVTWSNRELLAERGFLYPGQRRLDHYQAARLARSRRHGKVVGDDQQVWEQLLEEIRAWDGDALLSHEFFSMARKASAREVVKALAPAKVILVVTTRSYALQFPAMWQESVKMGNTLGFDEYIEQALRHETKGAWGWPTQDLESILGRWRGAVPPRNTRILTVPPPGGPADTLWKRWCTALQIDDTGVDLTAARSNRSLGAPQAALLQRAVNPALTGDLTDGKVRHRWVRGYLGHEVLAAQRGERFGLRPDQADRLAAQSAAVGEQIAAGRYTVIGDLADLGYVPPVPDRDPDDVGAEELLDVAARAIDHLVRDVRRLTNELAEATADNTSPRIRDRVRQRLRRT